MSNEPINVIELGEELSPPMKSGYGPELKFPCVSLGDSRSRVTQMYFNGRAAELLKAVEAFEIRTTPSYIVFIPKASASKTASQLPRSPKRKGFNITMPASLKALRLSPGRRKLFLCKHGYAISKYEVL